MGVVRVAMVILLVLSGARALAAEDAPASGGEPAALAAPAAAPPTARELPRLKAAPLTHTMQFGLAVLTGTGYRGIFPYQENIDCGQLGRRICAGRLPFFIDAEISYGVADHWDLLTDLRFGVEADFTGTHQFAVAPGFRYWFDPELPTKFFTLLQFVIDTTDQQDPAIKNTDFGLRNANGVMFEVMRNLGIYLQIGDTFAFRRWVRFEIDGGVGVQARFP
jgi:hypothetical protein